MDVTNPCRTGLDLVPQSGPCVRAREEGGSPTGTRGDAALNMALLGVYAAQETPELWDAVRASLHGALRPFRFACTCLHPCGIMPPTIFRERGPFPSESEFKRFQAINPIEAYLATHPNATVVAMSDILTARQLARTEFYREFMSPDEDRYIVYMSFWQVDRFHARIGLYRTREQGDFTRAELALLEQLHPHFDAALRRIVRLHRERALRLSLEQLVDTLPVAAMLLDWELTIVVSNRLARELCACWNGDARPDAPKNSGDWAHLSPEVVAYCQTLKGAWNPRRSRDFPLTGTRGVTVSHPHHPRLRASIHFIQLDAAPFSMPMFMINHEDRRSAPGAPASSHGALIRLSVREREVALLVSQGCSNDEVARRLLKSVPTVKKQLRSIYQKLKVSNRGRLTARIHDAATSECA